jgi:hypothetical protein
MVGMRVISDPCGFAAVPVTIERLSPTTVTFATRSSARTGDVHERLRRSFTVPLTEVHSEPFEDSPPPVEMRIDATGMLYLSRAGWQVLSEDGYRIFDAEHALLKKPDCAAITPRWLSRLPVVPTSVSIRGHLRGETAFFDIELLGPDAADSQSIRWNGAEHIVVRLTPRGARRLGLGGRATTALVWPVSIKIKGSPMIDMSVSGEIDILDSQMAEGEQNLELDKPGQLVTLVVTQDGCTAFHVTPQYLAEVLAARAQAASQGCVDQGRKRIRERASRAVRRRARARR